MKKYFLCLALFYNSYNSVAQSITSEEKLLYLNKAWGFLKYFHDGPSYCNVNWDSVLVAIVPAVKSATTLSDFNAAIQSMITAAGSMPSPASGPPYIPPGYNTNLDTGWFHAPVFEPAVLAQFDTIVRRFRPHTICHVIDNSSYTYSGRGYIYFDDDSTHVPSPTYPVEAYRILVACRYWNYIEYFFNSKKLMDIPWDSTFKQVIPLIQNAVNATDYHLGLLQLVAGINDTHASSALSPTLSAYFKSYMPPIYCKHIQNQVVIVQKLTGAPASINVGDVITKMNGVAIDSVLNARKKYIPHSNENSVYRDMLRGSKGIFLGTYNSSLTLEIQNASGTSTVNLYRSIDLTTFYNTTELPVYPTYYQIPNASCKIGYVNMGLLQPADVSAMYDSLKALDAIIFDIRNYPNGTAWDICPLLASTQYYFAYDYTPNTKFPGILLSKYKDRTLGKNVVDPFNKNIYILANEQTQSQAEYSTMMIHQVPNAIVHVVGSQTAGADGNVSLVYLPGGFYSYFSTLGIFYPDGTGAQRVGVKIDNYITPTVQGIRDGKDELMDYVLYNLNTCVAVTTDEQTFSVLNMTVFPNPVSSAAAVSYSLKKMAEVSIEIYNILGEKIVTLVKNEKQNAGPHQQVFSLPHAGIYFVELTNEGQKSVKKVVSVK